MDDVSTLRQREVETYFNVIAQGGPARRISARSFQNLGEWDRSDYEWLATTLADADAAGSFAFLGRDAERYAGAIEYLDDAGHEIVLHGYRHVRCSDIEDDLVHENLSRGLDAIEDASGVRPRGFISPGQEVNAATLEAMDGLDMEWVVGRTDTDIPASLDFIELAHPYDLIMLNEGDDPESAFDRIADQTEPGAALLFHPNMLEYYDALDEFTDWIDETGPTTVGECIDGGVGLLHDAMRPLRMI
jgi:peptidoglycan/xylan/chitin deacetylase (PgdA/CDA1 family)